MRGQRHAPAALYPGKDPVAIVQEVAWAPGPVWTGAENFPLTRIRSPDRPARSQSLYRLNYPAHVEWRVKRKVVPVDAKKTRRGSSCITPLILDIGVSLRRVVKFTPRPFYPGEGCRFPLNRRIGGPQRRYEHFEKEKNIFPIGTGTADLPDDRLIIIPRMMPTC